MSACTFQTLPDAIIVRILDTVSKHDTSGQLKSLKSPFLRICRNWRQVGLGYVFSTAALNFRHLTYGLTFKLGPLPSCEHHPNFVENKHVNGIKAYLNLENLFTGTALTMLDQLPQSDQFVFARASKLHVHLCDISSHVRYDLPEYIANVNTFFQRLYKIMPGLNDVKLITSFTAYKKIVADNGSAYDTFVTRLFEKAPRLSYGYPFNSPKALLKQIHNEHLTHLSFEWDRSHMSFVRLTHAQADVLVSLEINMLRYTERLHLINGKDGRPVVYKNMQSLHLTFRGGVSHEVPNRMSLPQKNVAYFPQLCKLGLYGTYVIEDGMFFQGHIHKLTHLSLTLSPGTIDYLISIGMMERCLFRSLDKAILNSWGIGRGNQHIEDLAPLLTNMTANARYLDISPMVLYKSWHKLPFKPFTQLDSQPGPLNIQILNLGKCWLSFTDVFDLIKQLPELTHLHCRVDSFSESFDHIGDPQLFKQMRQKYFSLGKCFRSWHIISSARLNIGAIAKMAVILAIVCPNFTFVQVPDPIFYGYEDQLACRLKNRNLAQYSDQIKRLFEDYNEAAQEIDRLIE